MVLCFATLMRIKESRRSARDAEIMMRRWWLIGLALSLAACAGGPSVHTEAACKNTPPQYGETARCAYYPGYGWAHVPVYHPVLTF